MTDQQDPRREQYDRVRSAFDDLRIEDKTIFLLKETINTIVQGIEEATCTLDHAFEAMFGGGQPGDADEASGHENGAGSEKAAADEAAAPKKAASKTTGTTRKRSTRSKSQGTTARTKTKKTTTKRTTPKKDEEGDT